MMKRETKDTLKWLVGLLVPYVLPASLLVAAKDALAPMAEVNPGAFTVFVIALLTLGICIGLMISSLLGLREKQRERRQAERDKAQKEQLEREKAIAQLNSGERAYRSEPSPQKKILAKVVYDSGGSVVVSDRAKWTVDALEASGESSGVKFFVFESIGRDLHRMSLQPWLKTLFDERPEVGEGFVPAAYNGMKAMLEEDESYISTNADEYNDVYRE